MTNGYKAFNEDFTSIKGFKHEVGVLYTYEKTLDPRPNGSGFYFSKNFEDTLVYFEKPIVTEIEILGEVSSYYHDYKEEEIFVTNRFIINRVVSRQELLNMASKLYFARFTRFISTINLTEEETFYLENKLDEHDYEGRKRYIDYYQRGDKDAFKRIRR